MAHDQPDPTDLSNRLILLSGGIGALGQAITTKLAAHGGTIAVNDILSPTEANRLMPQVGPAEYLQADTADENDVERLLDRCTAKFGRLPDTVCCHAGIVASHPIQDYPLPVFDDILRTNLRGPFILASTAARRWIANGQPGQLIFTTSWVQDVPWPGIAPYSATKAALRSLTRSFARELAPNGIRANAIAPGIVGAGMAQRQWDTEPDYRKRASKAIPLGYMQPPESVADAFLFLVSDLSSYMTGSVLVVDGGCSLYPMD